MNPDVGDDPVDVAVAGGGLVGLGIAWRCAQRGLSVAVVDPAPGSGAQGSGAQGSGGSRSQTSSLHFRNTHVTLSARGGAVGRARTEWKPLGFRP